MEFFQRGKTWYCDFTLPSGRRVKKTTKQRQKTAAQEAAKAIQAKELLRERRRDLQIPIKVPALVEYLGEFLDYIEASGRSKATGLYYRAGCRMLKGSRLSAIALDRIKTSDAEVLTFRGVSNSTANCALRTLSSVLSFAASQGIIASRPIIKLRRETGREAVIDAEVESRIIAVAPQPLRDVFILVQDTGCRPSEVVRLAWDTVLWDRSVIHVEKGKTRRATRFVPMSRRVRDVLRERAERAHSQWIFPSKLAKSGHLGLTGLEKSFRAVRERLGLSEKIVLYSGRHTFATDLLGETGNIKLVADTLGHASIQTTTKYLHPQTSGLSEIIDRRNQKREASNLVRPNLRPTHRDSKEVN
jgi:integrase